MDQEVKLIGLNGFMGSGKDTTFEFISNHSPVKVQRVAFADKLKIFAALSLGYPAKELDREKGAIVSIMDRAKKYWKIVICTEDDSQYTITGRKYLQYLGQSAREIFGNTFWIDQVLPKIRYSNDPNASVMDTGELLKIDHLARHYPDAALVVVTDVRYPNEAERVQALGGEVWEILRPGLSSDGHGSEIPLPRDLIDRVINNDGSLNTLSERVKEALSDE